MILENHNIALLIGAGLSCAVGMPSTREITEQILSGKNVVRLSGTIFVIEADPVRRAELEYITNHYSIGIRHIGIFLEYLKNYLDSYYNPNTHLTNYEDIYYLVTQIHDYLSGEYYNPIIKPFYSKLDSYMQDHLADNWRNGTESLNFVYGSISYINCIVAQMILGKEPDNLDKLSFLRNCCKDSQFKNVDIFTLNHDTVLENCLKQNHIEFADGFGEPEGLGKLEEQARYWNPELLKCDRRVRFYKLHGSINWFRFYRTNKESWSNPPPPSELTCPNLSQYISKYEGSFPRIGIPIGWDYWHIKDSIGEYQIPKDGLPLLLVGTHNKILDYVDDPIFLDLHYIFYNSLKNTQRLVVTGYSFGDKAINTRIAEWMLFSQNNRLVIIDPHLDMQRIPISGFRDRWDGWCKEKRLILFKKGVECVSWEEIKNEIG